MAIKVIVNDWLSAWMTTSMCAHCLWGHVLVPYHKSGKFFSYFPFFWSKTLFFSPLHFMTSVVEYIYPLLTTCLFSLSQIFVFCLAIIDNSPRCTAFPAEVAGHQHPPPGVCDVCMLFFFFCFMAKWTWIMWHFYALSAVLDGSFFIFDLQLENEHVFVEVNLFNNHNPYPFSRFTVCCLMGHYVFLRILISNRNFERNPDLVVNIFF